MNITLCSLLVWTFNIFCFSLGIVQLESFGSVMCLLGMFSLYFFFLSAPLVFLDASVHIMLLAAALRCDWVIEFLVSGKSSLAVLWNSKVVNFVLILIWQGKSLFIVFWWILNNSESPLEIGHVDLKFIIDSLHGHCLPFVFGLQWILGVIWARTHLEPFVVFLRFLLVLLFIFLARILPSL